MNKLGQIAFALAAVGSIGLVACGGGGDATPDAPKSTIDAPAATVKTVSCTGATIAATVTAPTFAYTSTPAGSGGPNTSDISVNGIIEFDLTTAADHPVGPATSGTTDSGLVAPTGAVTCLQFTAAGTFNYRCTVHGFTGSVTVAAQ